MQDLDTSQDDVLASFREERIEQRKKKPAILIGIVIGIVAAIAIGWLTFGRYVSVYYGADSGTLPVIHADLSVDGMRPETPGGMDVPNRDKLVYERLRKSNTELPVERLLPSMEKPVKPTVSKKETVKEPEDIIAALAADIIEQEQQQATAVLYEEDGTPVEVMFKETVSVEAAVPAKTVQKTEAIPAQLQNPAKQSSVQPAEQTEKYMVQLVSTRSQSAAESEWKRLSKKFKEIIADQPYLISKTVVASGTFYRLRVGQFETRDEAGALCDQLKSKKQECFVVK
ncbi:MAG: SPOR domain-containing protein [Alphaproteobacteria bacterium]|nr:SPOR domain-containing protein [Alphaproteobacteria bacterium]